LFERNRTEAALQQSEDAFRSLCEASPVGIFLCDFKGRIIYTNPRYQAIVGCTAIDVLDDGWQEFIHPDDREWFYRHWSAIIAAATEGLFNDLRYVNKRGNVCYTQVRTAPIRAENETVIHFVGTVEDMTEQRSIDQMKKDFISVINHELRTPLTAIRGSLGLIAGGVYDQKPDKMRQMLTIAATQSDRLVRLVNDILDLHRLEAGQTDLSLKLCNAASLIQQSVDIMRSQAELAHIDFSLAPVAIEVWADTDTIVQTLTNLLSNAIKFSSPNTTISINAVLDENKSSTQNYPAQDVPAQVLFSVTDQGRGIPADKLETIFGQFHQVDASDSREKGGTGLGLALCRNIIKQHGGKIWAESTLGKGSTFYFTLPATG
jgi:PAS domain S-box-containing protein